MAAPVFDLRAMQARKRWMVAVLLEHFHVSPADLVRLTDRQIADLYFHPRTKEGSVQAPKGTSAPKDDPQEIKAPGGAEGGTMEDEIRNLEMLADMLHMRPEDVARAREEIRTKFQGVTGGDGSR